MSFRRLLPLLALLALLAAPFGRMAAAEAMAMPHRADPAMAGHCPDLPAPDRDRSDKAAVDCMIACAAMAPAEASGLGAAPPARSPAAAPALPVFTGLHPEAEPPPPRLS